MKDYLFSDLGYADRCYITNENNEAIGGEVFIFDNNENVICEIEFDENKNEVLKLERKYSDNGNLMEEARYLEGDLEDINMFKYNAENFVVERVKKDIDGIEVEKEIIEYNERNEEIKKTVFANESHIIEEFLYDDKGNMVLNSVRRDGQLVFRNSCCYNEVNEVISEEILEIDWQGNIYRHEKLIHEYI